jgi:two-component system OmpR family response regulator
MAVLLIEDESDTATYVSSGLRAQGYEVEWCPDGRIGASRALQSDWDIMIIDRMLPENIDGLSIVAALKAHNPSTPVIILSALASLDEKVRGLREGGDDYLTKPFAFSELLARIEALLRRRAPEAQAGELRVADLRLDLRTRRAERGTVSILLQPREFRLLEFLVRHADHVVTRTMLLQSVWDYHFDPQTNVIDVHISRLRNKIDKGFSPALLHTIRGSGYMISARG